MAARGYQASTLEDNHLYPRRESAALRQDSPHGSTLGVTALQLKIGINLRSNAPKLLTPFSQDLGIPLTLPQHLEHLVREGPYRSLIGDEESVLCNIPDIGHSAPELMGWDSHARIRSLLSIWSFYSIN